MIKDFVDYMNAGGTMEQLLATATMMLPTLARRRKGYIDGEIDRATLEARGWWDPSFEGLVVKGSAGAVEEPVAGWDEPPPLSDEEVEALGRGGASAGAAGPVEGPDDEWGGFAPPSTEGASVGGAGGAKVIPLWGVHQGAKTAPAMNAPRNTRPVATVVPDRPAAREEGPTPGKLTDNGSPFVLVHGEKSSATWFMKLPGGTAYEGVPKELLACELERFYPWLEVTYLNGKDEVKLMNSSMLFKEYGYRTNLLYSYTEESAYAHAHPQRGTLRLRTAVMTPMEPEYSEEVEEWLRVLVGPGRVSRLKDWLACVGILDKPIAALYLEGPRSSGKGMLAAGLQQLWGGHIAAYDDVLGITSNFNAAMLSTPIVWLDEKAEKSPNAPARFRTLTGNSRHSIFQKNRDAATLEGCPRVLITANNADALRFNIADQLNQDDELAIAIRILHFRIDKAAQTWLDKKGGRQHTGEWVETADKKPGKLPRHIRWLMENWKVQQPGKRFLVEGDEADWFRDAHLREGTLAGQVMEAIDLLETNSGVRRACEPEPVQGSNEEQEDENEPVVRYWPHGEWADLIFVHSGALQQNWQRIFGASERTPPRKTLGSALRALSRNRTRERAPYGSRPNVYPIPRASLEEWRKGTYGETGSDSTKEK